MKVLITHSPFSIIKKNKHNETKKADPAYLGRVKHF